MKRIFYKHLVAMLVIVCLLAGEICSVPVYASEIAETEAVDVEETIIPDTEETDVVSESETVIETSESQQSTETEESAVVPETNETEETVEVSETEVETETVAEVQKITGFVGLSDSESHIEASILSKPALEEVLAVMPQKLQVYLDGSKEITEIEVTWFCVGEDYETSASHYFQFSPEFDAAKYVLAEDIDLLREAPYIGVFLAEGSGAALMAAESRNSNETEIFYFLVDEMRLNRAAACGILANIYCESGFNPNTEGDNGTSYGICQWHASRKTQLIEFCTQNGYDYKSLSGQLYFLQYELENNYRTIYNYMLNISDTEEGAYNAGYYWCYNFERPANTENTSIARGNLTKNTYWPKYGSVQLVPKLTSVKNNGEGVIISWERMPDATGYYVYRRSSASDGWTRIAAVAGNSVLNYADKTVSGNKTYYYTISAYYTDREFEDYRTKESLNYRTGPGTSYPVAGTLSKGTTVQVVAGSGSAANGHTWYEIYYKGNYYFASAAYLEKISGSSGSPSATESAKAAEMRILYLAPPEITGAANTHGGVKVTWKKVAGATGYYIYRKTTGGGYVRIAQVSGGSNLSYTDTKTVSGNAYTYTALAYSGSAKSGYKSEAGTFYLTDPDLADVAAVSNGVKVTWEKITGATGYCVYRKTNGGSWTRIKQVNSGSSVSCTDTNVSSGTKYTYTVRAYSNSGMSSYYDQGNIIYLPTPKLSSASGTTSGIKITWGKVTGAGGYLVYRKVSGGSWSRIAKVSGASTVNYTDSTAVSGKTYIYTVRAYNGSSISDYNRTGVSGEFSQTLDKYTTTAAVNYRTGPGTTYSVAGTLSKGTTVQVVSGYSQSSGGYTWYKIYLNGKYYYVSASYLKTSQTLVKYVTTESVNYRSGPGTTYSIAGTLSKGTPVQVVSGYSQSGGGYTWYKIYRDSKYYYISSSYIKKV